MPKQKKNKNLTKVVSKRQHAGQRRQRSLRNLVVIITAVVIVAVLGVVGWSVWNFQIKPYNQTVLRFNGESYNMRYFINTMKLYYGKAPTDMTIADFADYVEQQIEQNETIIQGAQALGVPISRSDIEQEIKDAGLPVTREGVDVTLAQRLLAQQVPDSQPQAVVEAMLLESEAAGQAAIARVKAGEPFASVANTTSKLPEGIIIDGELGWTTPREADLTLGSTKFGAMLANSDNGTLNGPTYDDSVMKQYGYWIAEAVEQRDAPDVTNNTTVEQRHLMGLLLGSEQDARDAMSQLAAGANVTELANQLSQSPNVADFGADIGWISQGQDPGGFGQVFDLPLNTPIGPMSENQTQTKGGWWVFNIVNKDANRALTSSQQNTLQNDFISQCTAALKSDPNYKVENLLTQKTKDFALNQAVLSLGKGSVLVGVNSLPDGEAGVPYSFQLTAYGDTHGATWSLTQGNLPDGLTMNTATGLISGTPRLAGGNGITVQVESKVHHDTKDLVLRIRLAITVSTTSLPNGQVGTNYSNMLAAMTDSDNYTWSIVAGSLPDGIQLTPQTGSLYGKPTTAGTYNFTAQVDDGLKTATQDLAITIDSANVTPSDSATP
jgi:nitrate reductase NapE component